VARSESTSRAYAADWQAFRAWCSARGVASLPASDQTLAEYVDDTIVHRRLATVRRRIAAVRARHVDAGRGSPTGAPSVRAALARAEWHGRDDRRDTAPLGVEELRAVSCAVPESLSGRRDRALVLVGYGAGLSPGELARLTVAEVRLVPAGLRIDAPRGRMIVPFGSARALCAVRAWKAWRGVADLHHGAAFRAIDRHGRVGTDTLTVRSVTRIVQRAVERAGYDGARYSGRSLRRGMVLAATEHGVSERRIMAHTGHRSRRLVRRYMTSDTDRARS
jgi:site-specific recombinase XerD